MEFRKYNHIERLTSPDVEGLLDGDITYSYKLDGTNASLRWDNDDSCIAAYSRKRRLSAEDDNAGFYAWAISDDPEAAFLRNFLFHNPDIIIYGEYLGSTKFIGHIKDYNSDTLGKLWIFDVFNTTKDHYLSEFEWRHALDVAYGSQEWEKNGFPWYIPYFEMENPTIEKIQKAAENNKFLLDNANHPGEGIVIRRADFRNKHGHYEMGKFVLDEFIQSKSKKKNIPIAGEIEKDIVETMVTNAELTKTKEKVVLACKAEEFDATNSKMIGMYINFVWKDAILDEIATIIKKWKNPTINFRSLNNLCAEKARKYLGLY